MFGPGLSVKPSGPGLLCAGNFLITTSIWLVVIGLFRLSASSWFSLEDCMFLGIYPFHSGCPISWHIVVHSNSLQSFVFMWYQLWLLFHFWFYLSGSSLFFSWWVLLKVRPFFKSFQRSSSWIHWSFELFFSLCNI